MFILHNAAINSEKSSVRDTRKREDGPLAGGETAELRRFQQEPQSFSYIHKLNEQNEKNSERADFQTLTPIFFCAYEKFTPETAVQPNIIVSVFRQTNTARDGEKKKKIFQQ